MLIIKTEALAQISMFLWRHLHRVVLTYAVWETGFRVWTPVAFIQVSI